MEKERLIKVLMCQCAEYEVETIREDLPSCSSSPNVVATVLSSLKSKEDVDRWISGVERATNTKFQVARTKVPPSGRVEKKVWYKCHHRPV